MGSIVGILGQVLYRVGPFLFVIFANYRLETSDFGRYVFYSIIAGLASACVIFATSVTGIGFASKIEEESRKFVSVIHLRAVIAFGMLLILSLVWLLVPTISLKLLLALAFYLIAAVIDAELLILSTGNFAKYIYLGVLSLLGYSFALAAFDLEWDDYLLVGGGIVLLANIWCVYSFRQLIANMQIAQINFEEIFHLVKVSVFIFLSIYQVMIVNRSVSIFLGIGGNLEFLGVYGFVEKISDILRIFIQSLHKVFLSSNSAIFSVKKQYIKNQIQLVSIGSVFILGSIFTAYLAVELVNIPQFTHQHFEIFLIVGVALFVHHLNNCVGLNYLMLQGHTYDIFKSNLYALIFIIGLLAGVRLIEIDPYYLVYVLLIAEAVTLIARLMSIKLRLT